MSRTAPVVTTVLLLVALVALSMQGTVYAALAVIAAVLAALLMSFGPERLGTWILLVGMALAPMNDLRPGDGSISISDLTLVPGFLLLLPTMLVRHARVPMLFAIGSLGLLIASIATSLLAEEPTASMLLALKLLIAGSVMPLLFLLWRPDRRTLRRLAWAYVAGQIASTGYALVDGAVDGRYFGASTHPNAFAIGGLMACTLLLYLLYEEKGRGRLLVLAAAAVCVGSIWMSGSRGGLLALIVVALIWPVIERTTASTLTIVGGAMLVLPVVGWLADLASSENSALGRLLGKDETASNSDALRRQEIDNAVEQFLSSPVIGTGYTSEVLNPHNIFLQVAVAVGVIGLAAWLLLLWSFVSVLISSSPDRRLGYGALAYLAVGMTQPSLWERNIWMALCLTLAAAATQRDDEGPATGSVTGPSGSTQRAISTSAMEPTAASTSVSSGSAPGARVRSVHEPSPAKNRK